MSIVDILAMEEPFEQDWSTPLKPMWHEAAQLPSQSSAPITTSFSHSQRSATLGWAQHTGCKEMQGQFEHVAPVCSAAALGTSVAPTFAGPARGRGEGVADFAWDMALLEELEKGSLGTTLTSELKIPDPIISLKREPPLVITPRLPPGMTADHQERTKACWDVLRSISEPARGLVPVQVRSITLRTCEAPPQTIKVVFAPHHCCSDSLQFLQSSLCLQKSTIAPARRVC